MYYCMKNTQEELKQELSDEELDLVSGGSETDYRKVYEIELGEFVCDAYKPTKKNIDLNKIDLTKLNVLNEKIDIQNNYEPCKYNEGFIKK